MITVSIDHYVCEKISDGNLSKIVPVASIKIFKNTPEEAFDTWLMYVKSYGYLLERPSNSKNTKYEIFDSEDHIMVKFFEENGSRKMVTLHKWDGYSGEIKKRYRVRHLSFDKEDDRYSEFPSGIHESTWWFNNEDEWISKISELNGSRWSQTDIFTYNCGGNNNDLIADYTYVYEPDRK